MMLSYERLMGEGMLEECEGGGWLGVRVRVKVIGFWVLGFGF
jgi:hypothetical protein